MQIKISQLFDSNYRQNRHSLTEALRKLVFTDQIVLLIPLVLAISWILLENHGFFGDEVTHIGFLKSALTNAAKAPNIWAAAWQLYYFNDTYPPLFYLLSVPFVILIPDTVLGARIYIAILYFVSAVLFHKLLKEYVSSWCAALGVIVLCTSPVYLQSGRYYLIEIMLLNILIIAYIFFICHLKTGRYYYVLAASLAIASGCLTKFNFVIYAIPLVCFYFGVLFLKNKGRPSLFRVLGVSAITLLFVPLIIAGPWYLPSFIYGGGPNALGGLKSLIYSGALTPDTTIGAILRSAFQYDVAFLFPNATYLVFFLAVGMFFLKKLYPRLLSDTVQVPDSNQADFPILFFWLPTISIFFLTFTLHLLGLGTTLRWNLSYLFFAIIVSYLADGLRSHYKRGFVLVSGIFLVVIASNSFLAKEIPSFGILDYPEYYRILQSNPKTTGVLPVLELIMQDRSQQGFSLSDEFNIGVVAHIHKGYHAHNLTFYTKERKINTTILTVGILALNQPAEPTIFLKSDYLTYIPNYRYSEPVRKRYQYIVDHLPESYEKCLQLVGIIDSRFGSIKVQRLDRKCLTPQAVYDIIQVGSQYDHGSPMNLFWEVEKMIARLTLEPQTINTSNFNQFIRSLNEKERLVRSNLSTYYQGLYSQKVKKLQAIWLSIPSNQNALGNELVRDPGFEDVTEVIPAGWIIGNESKFVLDTSGKHSFSGKAAVEILGEKGSIAKDFISVNSASVYFLSQYTRADRYGQNGRFQVNWLNSEKQFISTDIQYFEVSQDWTWQLMLRNPS